jgi:hypothetical protein
MLSKNLLYAIRLKFILFYSRFMMVLVCLIFSVLATIEYYSKMAEPMLFWMVSYYYYLMDKHVNFRYYQFGL